MSKSLHAQAPADTNALSTAIDATANLGTGLQRFVGWVVSAEGQVVVALGAASLASVVLLVIKRLLQRALERRAQDCPEDSIALLLVRRLTLFFAVMAGLRFGLTLVDAPQGVDAAVGLLFTLATVLQGALWAQTVALYLLARFVERHEGEGSTVGSAFVLLRWMITVAIWSVALLLFLGNLGVNITGLVAGLGIGGVAIALAAQSTIGNFFSAFSIIADKPFQRGDLVRFSGVTATVEEIGLRTTRLRSLDGHQVIVSNTKLLDETIDNLRRMDERRAIVTIGVAYETAPAVVREIPAILKACVHQVATARLNRCHLSGFGPSSLDFELAFFALGRDYQLLMDTKQEVLFNVFEAFADRGIVIAYPTQTLHIAHPQTEPSPSQPHP